MLDVAPPLASRPANPRKREVWENAQAQAARRRRWREKASFFHAEDDTYLRFLIPPGQRVLEIGCGTGDTLAALEPSLGVGIDFSPAMIAEASKAHPHLTFHVGDAEDAGALAGLPGPFDVILIVDTLGVVEDVQALFEALHPLCGRETRLVVAYYSHLWQPALRLAEAAGLRMPHPPQNVLSPADVRAVAELADFDPVKTEIRLLSPFRLLGLGRLLNRFLSPLPLVRHLSLRHYMVARSMRRADDALKSATVVVPARNERGNVESAVRRIPAFCDDIEIIFVEGHSKDGTFEEMERVKAAYPERDIKLMRQPGKGKADAVFAAFDAARGDVLMILDADLTMPPEQLPKFWAAIRSGKGELVNGSRLVYPMEDEAMRFLNLLANKAFALIFSWLLNQRITDTLCGTKVLRRSDYERLKRGRAYFGDFDPFGDFDLIFGASKLNLKTVDVPIRYASRVYGETQISRFRHGFMLLRMVVFAFLKIKAV
ncbi:MAG TPA: bifunctional class I SAM-dependent methyltransferase/glycosyltransferase family 2 protein [Beijerinckiaceae bacterium]|jgi:SAM-dependent methyltransferase